MAGVLEFNESNFEREVIKSSVPVLIDFWAAWCAPCRLISPVVDEIAGELKGTMKVGKVDVDNNPEIASRFSILNIPTLLLFKDGEEASRIIGVNTKEAILTKIKGVIGD
jgi:thioredoxin 1